MGGDVVDHLYFGSFVLSIYSGVIRAQS